MLDLCLLGTSGMMPLPHRALTALMTRFNGSSLLIDCGEGTQVSIREKGWSIHDIDIICITHVHGDHISGLPGLLLSMGNDERVKPLAIIGPKGVKKVSEALMTIAPGLPFEISFIELSDDFHSFELCGYIIEAFKVKHTVSCYGYNQVIKRAGKFDTQKAKANEVPLKLWSRLQKEDAVEFEGKTYTKDMVLGAERKGIKVTYCTDTRPVPEIAIHAKDADLFICEGMYGDDSMVSKAKKNRHMTFKEAAVLGNESGAKEVWLTHYSPSCVGPKKYIKELKKICQVLKAGEDLKSKTIVFEEE